MNPTAPAAFATPDADHSPAAYWFWHRLPTPDEIRSQIAEMLAGGYRSFQIQPRLAYPIADYLGEDYLAACQIAVAEAARLGMTVGIYDDYNWQSGQAGGRTVRGEDQLRECHVFWSSAEASADAVARCWVDQISSSAQDLGPAGMAWQYDNARMAWADWRVIAALAHPREHIQSADQIIDVTGSARITSSSEAGCTATANLHHCPPGYAVTVFTAARCATSRLPNYLLPESALRFIEVGYQPYFATFGEHFGRTVKYFFFDQPHATFYDWPQRHGNLGSSLPYAPRLADDVRKRTARPFGTALLALVMDVGPETAALRCDFYQAYTELACSSYLGPLAAWCQEHGVALSGHEVLGHVGSWNPGRAFAGWDLRVNFGMDYFGTDSYRGITGVDAEDCVPQLSAKLGDSVARSNGRSGCIVEQYMAGRYTGGTPYSGDWGLTPSELRAQAIRLHLSGARQFLFHAFYQTDGTDHDSSLFTNPRFDFPPGINFEPWWPFHRAFADEIARLSTFLDQAEPACDVAVLYPLRTCWAEGPRHGFADHLEFWASFLAEEGFGYHLIDERDLLAAEPGAGGGDGRLRIGGREYGALVLPSVTTLQSAETMSVIRSFAAGGGLLVSSGDTPARVQRGDPSAVRQQWADTVAASGTARHFPALPSRQQARQTLAPLLASRLHVSPAESDGAAGRLWSWAGQDESAWRLAIFNDGPAPVPVTITGPGEAFDHQTWVTQTGETGPWQAAPQAEPGRIRLELRPMELRTLRLRPARDRAGVPVPRGQANQDALAVEEPLTDGWTLRIPGLADTPQPVRVDRGWEQQGFPAYSGVGYYARTFNRNGSRLRRLRLPQVSAAVEVTLNGQCIGSKAWEPYEFELPELRKTANKLEITVFSAAANKYYSGTPYRQHPEPSGLLAAPTLISY